jgi:site-specific recombinase XerD
MLSIIYNTDIQSTEWIMLNLNQVKTSRQKCFRINKQNKLNVGMNAVSNRLHYLNDKIPLEWLNKPYSSFKIECKRLLLP